MRFLFVPGRSSGPLRPGLIVLMSLPPAIPWRVALQHRLPPLHRLFSMLHPTAENSQALLKLVREFFGRQKNISALDNKKALAGNPAGAVQQSMSWVRPVGRF